MKNLIQIYAQELGKGAKYALLALGISVLFYLFAIPNLEPGQHLEAFGVSLFHGLSIFLWVWILFAGIRTVARRIQILTGKEKRIGWKIYVFIGIAASFAGLTMARLIIAESMHQPFSIAKQMDSFLIAVFITLMLSFYFSFRKSSEENLKLQAAKTEAELHVLKNQMQPHFLFNSLNSLAELIESNQAHASTMTQHLADLYREILENSKHPLSSLASEISIIRKYLALEKLRFGDRLNYHITVPPQSDSALIPSLLLQTLVENAVKHGIALAPNGGMLSLQVSEGRPGFHVEILNTGLPFQSLKSSNGTGIENTRSRLQLLDPDQHQFKVEGSSDGTKASFWFSGDKNVG